MLKRQMPEDEPTTKTIENSKECVHEKICSDFGVMTVDLFSKNVDDKSQDNL